jgi:diadenosine tetraphosphate (Ap4A) HIT family hydrolase
MQKDFRAIQDKYRKRKQPMSGLRKLECTYSQLRGDFHPHFHVIVSGRDNANNLLNDWIKRNPTARLQAQDISEADENSLKDLFKYFTKVVSKTASQSEQEYSVNVEALDKINQAFYRKRVFQGFGGVKSRSEEVEEIQSESINNQFEGGVFEWVQEVSDWVSEYGEPLTNNDHYKRIKVNLE